jgi:hypothetical protein
MHTDNLGSVHFVQYLAEVGTDYVAVRNARIALLDESLAETEALDILGGD